MIQFVSASSLSNLQSAITTGTISSECIAFIPSENLIYANGNTYECNFDSSDIESTLSTLTAGSVASASYSSTDQTIYLLNSEGTTISTIDASAFIKDGMLNSAEYVTTDASGNTGAFIHLTFNTDAGLEAIYVDVSDLIDTYTAGDGLELADHEFSVTNALSDTEKAWIEEQLFDTLFTVSISRSASSAVFSGSSYTVTWTLTCQYNGTNVDLDSTPSGWTWSSTGIYTKTTTVTSSTGSSVSSGSASCTYTSSTGTSGTKTASSVSCTNIKYSYIYTTTDSELSSLDNIDYDEATQMSSSNTVSGTYSITFTEGQYCYFIIANTSSVSSITQLGLNYVNDYESMTRTNYGTYKVYRSTNAMSASTQEVTVA